MKVAKRRYFCLVVFASFMLGLLPWRMAEAAFAGTASNFNAYFTGFVQMQNQAEVVYGQQLANMYFLGRPGLAGALLTGTGITGVNPAQSRKPLFAGICANCQSGYAFEPHAGALWDPAYGGWRMPFELPYVNAPLKGVEIIFRIKPNGNLLTQMPVPGQPWPGLLIGNRANIVGDLPSFSVEMDLRATAQYGQDQLSVIFSGNTPNLFYSLGTWVQYAETAAGNGIWEAGTATGNVSVFSTAGTPGNFAVNFDATTCDITGSRAGGTSAYSPTKNLSLTLGPVSPSAFTGDGSTSNGGPLANGELRISCLKYAHENIRLTLSSSSEPGVPSQGVVLSDPSVSGRSSNVGVQLSYCLSGMNYGDAQLGVQSCPTTPFPLGVDVGSARTPGVEFYQSGGSYRFGGNAYVNPDLDLGVTHIYLLARYYQVGTGAAQPGIVQTNYTLTLDNL